MSKAMKEEKYKEGIRIARSSQLVRSQGALDKISQFVNKLI